MSGVASRVHVPPVVWLGAAAGMQAALSRRRRGSGWSLAAGAGLAACSLGVAAASIVAFARRGTTVDPLHVDRASALVQSGVNARTRNPMYVGMAGGLLAITVARRSWLALLPAVGFVTAIDRLQIPGEEAALEARFGEEYRAYRRRVPRWLDARSLRSEAKFSRSKKR